VADLKNLGLFPLEIYGEAREEYSPRTPPYTTKSYERIRKNVLTLHYMDTANKTGTPQYRKIEESIRKDLSELARPTAEGGVLNIPVFEFSIRGTTGTCGVNRDRALPND